MNRKVLIVLFFTFVLVSNGWTQERKLKEYSTYQTSLTNEDIMRLFVNEVITYLQRYDSYGCYYWVGFKVYQGKNEQNWAWATRTVEEKFQWETVYKIHLFISNAALWVYFCNTFFTTDDQPARQIVTTRAETVGGNRIRDNIAQTAASMFTESELILKMYNDKYSDKSRNAFAAEILRIFF
jgi:hypothetical protein